MDMTRVYHYDNGFDTIYERSRLYNYLRKIKKKYNLKTVLETPLDGITGINGINSLILAKLGVKVVVNLPSKNLVTFAKAVYQKYTPGSDVEFEKQNPEKLSYKSGSFDLVWNFNALPMMKNHRKTLEEMIRVSRKYVLIILSNNKTYGFFLHRLLHKMKKEPWNHGNVGVWDYKKMIKNFREKKLEILETPFIDVPFWPDSDMAAGEILATFFPFLRPFVVNTKFSQYYRRGINNLPYFDEERYADILSKVEKASFIEKSSLPNMAKQFFAHHRVLLGKKKDR